MSLLHRLLLCGAAAAFALSTSGCQTTVIGCESSNGGADIPDPSFEETPTAWQLAPHSTIDAEESVCNGSHALKIELDSGLGPAETTKSAALTGIQAGKQYEIAWQYRFENCNKAELLLTMGNYTKTIHFEGTDGAWKKTSLLVTWGTDPAIIELRPMREGSETDFQGGPFDNNLMWIDDFTITATN
ncbi:MAG: hypothetical protein U0441_17000 [Polyangiaceae bacterium]